MYTRMCCCKPEGRVVDGVGRMSSFGLLSLSLSLTHTRVGRMSSYRLLCCTHHVSSLSCTHYRSSLSALRKLTMRLCVCVRECVCVLVFVRMCACVFACVN